MFETFQTIINAGCYDLISIEPAETFNENPTACTGGTLPLPRAAEKHLEDRK